MTKNITVIDEKGNILYSTYPKRAVGLIKKGRARRVSKNTIRLCDRSVDREENEMAANIYEVFDNQISKMQEQLRDADTETAMPVRIQILKSMEAFRAQEQENKVIDMVREQLEAMQKALNEEAVTAENAAAREVTRQQMLSLMAQLVKKEAPSVEKE
jgi:hypothetical protein